MRRLYLTENEDSWVDALMLPSELIKYARSEYLKLFNLHPEKKGKVLVFNKETKEHEEKEIYRYFESYLNTPKFDPSVSKSYMFSGLGTEDITKPLPKEFEPFYNEFKDYNQIVINWYNAEDYIEPHSDCTAKMVENSSIALVNLNESDDHTKNRKFKLKAKDKDKVLFDDLEYSLNHGLCIIMGGKTQEYYRHSVGKGEESRISITLRNMI
jgi:alkylated DNA repair dioxygenase AlkB